jgi:heme/copper-type cytochrome/quinol oxidase subunit 1
MTRERRGNLPPVGMLRRHWLTLVGLIVAVAGGLILVSARVDEFGWTAYAPLNSGKPKPPSVWVFDQPQALIGLLLLVVGVACIGAGIGRALARRH